MTIMKLGTFHYLLQIKQKTKKNPKQFYKPNKNISSKHGLVSSNFQNSYFYNTFRNTSPIVFFLPYYRHNSQKKNSII